MSFLTPLFWLGLAATAVPIIVHLVRRTRAPRIEFPSLMFVRRVPQRTIRRRRIQNLLLLILRCLAFFLLVFAFVRPYFSDGKAGLDGASKAEVILIDRSFSMRMGDRFARARARAAELIADQSRVTGDGTTQAIILFDQGYEVVSQLTADRPLLAARLAEIRVGDGATNLDQALQAAESLLRAQPAATRTIHLLTDFQATGRTGGGTTYRPRPGIQIVPFDVGEVGGPNLAISEVTGVGTIHQPKYTDRLTARISNFGAELVSAAKVEFRLNDRPIEKREVSLPAGESRTLEFTGFNLTEGPNQASILVEGDRFNLDNRFEFSLQRRARSKALIIESATRATGGGRDESLYLRNALTAGENNPFEVEVRTAGTVNPADLKNYRLVVVNDATLSPGLSATLIKEIENGLCLIVGLGPHTAPASFNASLREGLGVTLGEPAGPRGDYVTLSETRPDHPLFEPFRQAGRLPTTRVREYRLVEPGPATAVIARFDNGAPALLESSRGRGRALLITTTLDTGWNDLPLTPYYLPLVRQMTRYLIERESRLAWTVGETLPIERATDGRLPDIDTPAGKRLPTTSNGVIGLAEAGLYRLRYADRTETIAVNIDRRESDPARLDVASLLASLAGAAQTPTGQTAVEPNPGTAATEPAAVEARQNFWFYLLIAALLLFITEGLMARRIRMARIIN